MTVKTIDHDMNIIVQETYYWCGPASTQNVLSGRGVFVSEQTLAGQLGTTVNGTDWIGQFPKVLNRHIGGGYQVREMPKDPPTAAQKQTLWNDIVAAINAGYGIVANIVAPPSNYPVPSYGPGTIYHYIAIMGYDSATRRVLIADSGFRPFQYWISLDQLASLIPPKGYAYPTDITVTVASDHPIADAELSKSYPSRSKYRTTDEPIDTLAGFILNIDGRVHETWVERGNTP
jgi:hypothetical protein